MHELDSKEEKIVGMASRCLTTTESRYSNIERERVLCGTICSGEI